MNSSLCNVHFVDSQRVLNPLIFFHTNYTLKYLSHQISLQSPEYPFTVCVTTDYLHIIHQTRHR